MTAIKIHVSTFLQNAIGRYHYPLYFFFSQENDPHKFGSEIFLATSSLSFSALSTLYKAIKEDKVQLQFTLRNALSASLCVI